MKLEILFAAFLLIFLAGCKNSNDPVNDESGMIYYYALQNNDVNTDGSGFYSYDFASNTETLMTKKKIVKSTHIAQNKRFVVLEETKEGNIEFYGICDGNLIKVPKPYEYDIKYKTIKYQIDLEDYPMEIDKAGHNFVFLTYHKDMESDIIYFPVLARFNCEEWKMNIIDLKADILKELGESPKDVSANPEIIIEDDEIFFSITVEYIDRNEQYICRIIDDKLTEMHKIESPSSVKLLSCMSKYDRYLFVETDYGNIIKKIKFSTIGIEEINQNSKVSFMNNCDNFHKIHENYLYGINQDIVKIDLNFGTDEIIYSREKLNKLDESAEFYSVFTNESGNRFAFCTKNINTQSLYFETSSGDIQKAAEKDDLRFLAITGD